MLQLSAKQTDSLRFIAVHAHLTKMAGDNIHFMCMCPETTMKTVSAAQFIQHQYLCVKYGAITVGY